MCCERLPVLPSVLESALCCCQAHFCCEKGGTSFCMSHFTSLDTLTSISCGRRRWGWFRCSTTRAWRDRSDINPAAFWWQTRYDCPLCSRRKSSSPAHSCMSFTRTEQRLTGQPWNLPPCPESPGEQERSSLGLEKRTTHAKTC